MKPLPLPPEAFDPAFLKQNNRQIEMALGQLDQRVQNAETITLDATIAALAAANWAANAIPIGSGADTLSQVTFAANTFPARASAGNLVAKPITDFGLSLVDDANAAAGRTTLGLVIGSDVMAYDAELAALAALVSDANKLPYFSGIETAALTDFTAFARTLLDDSDAATMRGTLGLGTAALATIGTSGDTVPKNNTGNTFSAAQTIDRGSIGVAMTVKGGTQWGYFFSSNTAFWMAAEAGVENAVGVTTSGLDFWAGNASRLTITSASLAATVPITTGTYTVAGLPAGAAGMRAFVTDANATTFASVVAGGGANGVPVYHDGTNWRIG